MLGRYTLLCHRLSQECFLKRSPWFFSFLTCALTKPFLFQTVVCRPLLSLYLSRVFMNMEHLRTMKRSMWPCDFDKCERPAVRILGDCVICSKHLCSEHLQRSYHRCPTPEVITFLQIRSGSLTDQFIRMEIFSIRRSRRQKITKLRNW